MFGRAAPYNLIIVIICVECGAEECGANFHAVHDRIHVGDNILSNSGDCAVVSHGIINSK